MIKSLGQLLVEGAVVAGIDIGAKDAATKYARAQIALQVAAGFQAVANGDPAAGAASAQSLILSKLTDAGQIALVQAIFTVAVPQLQVISQLNGTVPFLNSTVQGAAAEIAAGITNVASAYAAPASAPKAAAIDYAEEEAHTL